MKVFFKICFILFFSLISTILILLLYTRNNIDSRETLKKNLAQSKVYEESASELTKQIDNNMKSDTSNEIASLVISTIKQQVTAPYLQGKTEKFIDDTDDWIRGKKNEPPVISFQEIKTKVIEQNTNAVALLQQTKEFAANKDVQANLASVDTDGTNQQDTVNIDLNKLIQNDFSIPVGKNLTWLKTLYQFGETGIIVVGISLLILILGIVLLSENSRSRLKWMGATFFATFLWNSIVLLFIIMSQAVILLIIKSNEDVPVFFLSLANAMVPSFVESFTKFGFIVLGVIFGLSILCFVPTFFMHTNPIPAAPVTKTTSVKSVKTKNNNKAK